MRVSPITCLRPNPEVAGEFASLPYDVFDRAEAAAYVREHPKSFLAIDRPETQFGPEQDMYAPEVYAKANHLLSERMLDGTLLCDTKPCYYVYRLAMGSHAQTGVVAGCEVDDYLDGTIKRHENTRAEKERDRIEHISALSAQTGPIFLAYRDQPVLDAIIAAATSGKPLYDFVDGQGVHQSVWRIARPEAVEAIRTMFDAAVPAAYIADGHHRAASAVKVSLARREQAAAKGDPDDAAEKPYDRFLAVLFPSNQLEILPYNRVVADRNGLSVEQLLDAVRAAGFSVAEANAAVEPTRHGQTGLYVGGTWYDLRLDPARIPDDPVASLDASLVQDLILGPILGIDDPTRDPRISFVGGVRGTDELERRAGDDGVALSMHATAIDELLSVADAGRLMPPKSTWFEPKLLSGLFIRQI